MKTLLRKPGMLAMMFMIVSLFFVSNSFSQITQPTAWTKAYDQQTASANSHSFAIGASSNRILVVAIATSSGDNSGTVQNPTTITYGTATLTQATGNGTTSARMHTWLYFLKDNAVMDGTSKALSITMGAQSQANNNFSVWYSVFAGVDQTPGTYTTGNGLNNNDGSGPAALSAAMTVNANHQAVYISNIFDNNSTTVPVYTINANWTTGGNNSGKF